MPHQPIISTSTSTTLTSPRTAPTASSSTTSALQLIVTSVILGSIGFVAYRALSSASTPTARAGQPPSSDYSPTTEADRMSSAKAAKSRETQMISEFRDITGATMNDATRLIKKFKSVESAIDAFYSDPAAQANALSGKTDKTKEKKLSELWERFKDASDPELITIDGTMQLCEELGIDPSSDPVLFCLATDLGSKATGEWEKEPFVKGWAAMPGTIDSIESMKNYLPSLRSKLNSDPVYFKKVYMHTFDLAKAAGARVLALDSALDLWSLYIPAALTSRPSALARVPTGEPPTSASNAKPPAFDQKRLDQWLEFQRKKGRPISKDTWSLFIDFIRTIDVDFKEYDDSAAWPSTIDDFVDYVRSQ